MQQQDGQLTTKFDEKHAVHVVVAEKEVHIRSQQGYVLVAVLYTDVAEMLCDSESTPVTDPGYTYPNRTNLITHTKHQILREPRFLMRLDWDSALAEKEKLVASAHERANRVAEEHLAEKKRADALEKEKEKLVTERDTAHKNYMSSVKNYEEQRDGRRRLEGDIAKLRNAVGEIRMKEILGTG
jgi:hypothetical protein